MENDQERIAQEKMVIAGVAVLFRAASIASGKEEEKNDHQNTKAIERATEFVNACKAHGLLPEKPSEP